MYSRLITLNLKCWTFYHFNYNYGLQLQKTYFTGSIKAIIIKIKTKTEIFDV